MTILLTTHYLDEAEQLCDRVAIVHQGRVVALDSPAALLAHMESLVELRVDGDVSTAVTSLRGRGLAGDDAFAVGATLHVPVHDRPAHGRGVHRRAGSRRDRDHQPSTHPRRRLPPAHRRAARRLNLVGRRRTAASTPDETPSVTLTSTKETP